MRVPCNEMGPVIVAQRIASRSGWHHDQEGHPNIASSISIALGRTTHDAIGYRKWGHAWVRERLSLDVA